MWRCEDVDLQMWRCEDVDLQMWRCEDLDLQVWRCEDVDLQVWGCEDVDVICGPQQTTAQGRACTGASVTCDPEYKDHRRKEDDAHVDRQGNEGKALKPTGGRPWFAPPTVRDGTIIVLKALTAGMGVSIRFPLFVMMFTLAVIAAMRWVVPFVTSIMSPSGLFAMLATWRPFVLAKMRMPRWSTTSIRSIAVAVTTARSLLCVICCTTWATFSIKSNQAFVKSEQNVRVCSISKDDGRRGTFEEDLSAKMHFPSQAQYKRHVHQRC